MELLKLISGVTSTQSIPNISISTNVYKLNSSNGMVCFQVWGTGTGTWTATVNFDAVLGVNGAAPVGSALDGSPVSVTISNANPADTLLVSTSCHFFTAWVSSLTGTCSINAGIEA